MHFRQVLPVWEERLEKAIHSTPSVKRLRVGGLLGVVPARESWENFVQDVRISWHTWEPALHCQPACFVMLYSGVAFYEFQSGNFWEGFAATLNAPKVPPNEQTRLNQYYRGAASSFNLEVTLGHYVSSAVRHIGVPLSMWEGFLRICEWALWNDKWEQLSADAWRNALTRRLGGRKRLIGFLTDNRTTATEFIQEMLDARNMLRSDPRLTISDLTQASILRREYFEEVPETADFLRENDPESLFSDRARLAWDEERGRLVLNLPPVNREKLPALWKVNELQQAASTTAAEIVVNGRAFSETLNLIFEHNEVSERQRLPGINGWAFYDEAKGRMVQPRDSLPVAQYTILSSTPLKPELKGWSSDPDNPEIDIESTLADGTPYYTTRLLPTSRTPKLRVNGGAWINFSQRRNVTLRVFCGPPLEDGTLSLRDGIRFSIKNDDILRVEGLPTPFLEVPLSLVSEESIQDEFIVLLDNKPARGKWITYDFDPAECDETTADSARCCWKWAETVAPPWRSSQPITSLDKLKELINSVPSPHEVHRHSIAIKSRRLGALSIGSHSTIEVEVHSPIRASLWPKEWGDFIAWILLAHVQDEASWEEVRFASDALAKYPIKLGSVYHTIRKLEQHGFITIRGHRYINYVSQMSFEQDKRGFCFGKFCGVPTLMYDLIRAVCPLYIEQPETEWGHPPTLRLQWNGNDTPKVRKCAEGLGIQIVSKLW